MDISLSLHHSSNQDFILTLDPEGIYGNCSGDTAYLRVPAQLKRGSTWNKPPLRGYLPMLLDLYGILGSGIAPDGSGAMLTTLNNLPIDLTSEENYEQGVNLSFACSRRYIQQLEEERAHKSQAKRMLFTITLWGTVALAAPRQHSLETAATQPIQLPSYSWTKERWIDIGAFKSVQNRNNELIYVSLSHWEEILPNLGYPRRASFELPALDAQNIPEEVRAAADHINAAHQFFQQEEYGAAVQRCRQARDALLVPNKKTWCQEHLGSVMGTEKAAMIDEAIAALNHLGHPASHGDSPVEIDRDAAEYVIATMTLILHYIDRKLR